MCPLRFFCWPRISRRPPLALQPLATMSATAGSTVVAMIPSDWQHGGSSAIAAFRYLSGEGVLQVAYTKGRLVYDFPCPPEMYERFLSAGSRGRFVQNVMRPYARQRGWSRAGYPWPW
jgi:hypothetical protein